MAYRKFAADLVFTGEELLDNRVLVTGNDGTIVEIVRTHDAGDDVELFNGILCPGFINCHCHLELSHLKNKISRGSGMIKFLLTVMSDRFIAEEEIEAAIQAEEKRMHMNGTVAVGDICNTTHTLKTKKQSALFFHNFIEGTGFVESSAELRFRQAHDVFAAFAEHFSSSSIVPHAPYSVSDKLLRIIDGFDTQSLLTLHNQESEAESEFFAYATGGFLELYRALKVDVTAFRPKEHGGLVHFLQQLHPGHSLILVHNVHTAQRDLDWIAHHPHPELFWCLCPNANLYIGNKLPDVDLLLNNNCTIVVGTDSLASNAQLDMIEELKTLQTHYPAVKTAELLKWATKNGAAALNLSGQYGTFEKDKRPGIVIIEGGSVDSLEGAASRRLL